LAKLGQWTMEIVKRSDKAEGLTVLPRCWVDLRLARSLP